MVNCQLSQVSARNVCVVRLAAVVGFLVLAVVAVHVLVNAVDRLSSSSKLLVHLSPQYASDWAADGETVQEFEIRLELLHREWADLVTDPVGTVVVEIFGVLPEDARLLRRMEEAGRSPELLANISEREYRISEFANCRNRGLSGGVLTLMAGYKDCREVRCIAVTATVRARGKCISGCSEAVGF